MKKSLFSFLAAAALATGLYAAAPAEAQGYQQAVGGVNCAMLAGSPFMCVKNQSQFAVVGIQASSTMGFNQNGWIRIPGASSTIQPGNTAIIKFNSWAGGCNQFVTILTADGKTHTYPFIDVCQNVSFVITPWN